ncbi:hypothetical protein AMIS_12400 [Actinoplanes missouriensis 431]|uniref:Uncharacterized protein n=1 Tax=Actinoplanes missouriensis (strain ATCC 14538 / DSM 43046 / CBS 188.64 / JCM 3121 / NBRC 102363 / NCIMB 12654 / NRRL B-3342 / UNCC 431) TaxID=512565 RepID=I0H0C3_ACTM4|nr:hypothetical protein [Actinoplanes missouriensis]BAL86460.1 hypothetical protein AMIS_12400 [Actinoplanes missouriensis 431]
MTEENQADVERRDRRRDTALFVTLAATLSVGPPLGLGWLAGTLDPSWHWGDWMAQTTQVVTGLIFFGLAMLVGRRGERRAEALANSELITSMGALSMSSARSFAGHDAQALRIAADARAALQHYSRASRAEQSKLVAKITDSYSDLTFGTFARAHALPRSVWTGLKDGAADLVDDARTLADGYGARATVRRTELQSMIHHITFAVSVGQAIIRQSQLTGTQSRQLTKIASNDTNTLDRLNRLRMLYRRELTVIADWNVLLRAHQHIVCSVYIHDPTATSDWLTPWYLEYSNDRATLTPVNVRNDKLAEPARHDRIDYSPGIPVYPQPVMHGSIPQGLRTKGIENQVRLLRKAVVPTVCVLTYELICGDGRSRRLVLDGNHRLAAAHHIAKSDPSSPTRILEFRITENEVIDTECHRTFHADTSSDKDSDWEWKGFTPDVGTIRAAFF